jgi:phenylalanyl-tRNA synthetase beta chain
MKISLAWLFDHIDGDLHKIDVQNLVAQFNLKVAEIESFEKVVLDPEQFTVVRAEKSGVMVEAFAPQLTKYLQLDLRSDLQIGCYYLLKKTASGWVWASGQHLGSNKENLFPALYFESDEQASRWHEQIDLIDYILEVDNKSLTHRPDMWGHRGFAREVAVLLNLELLPEGQFLAQIPVKASQNNFVADAKDPISSSIASMNCKRLATLYIRQIVNLPSQLWMAFRLFRVDMRGISHLVDLTNYVMLDLGQPMHVFDASLIAGKQLMVRQAKFGEKLELLSGEVLELSDQDLIIADNQVPLSLAGIKGGACSGTTLDTRTVLLESANFEAASIRRSAARYKLRTEASTRFEKTLDPNQNIAAIERFVKLYQAVDSNLIIENHIISLGVVVQAKTIELTHAFIENRLGIEIKPEFVTKILNQLGFQLTVQAGVYQVQIPSWRASKDVNLAEDLVEEVARMWGYDNILPQLPNKMTQPGNLEAVFKIRQIKQYLSAGAGMHEVENYPFYDETFLHEIKWQPQQAVEIVNPVSENWRRLITSLVPHLCKNVQQNSHDHDELRYFEWGRMWYPKGDGKAALELKVLAGVFFKKSIIDFYEVKSYLQALFDVLKLKIEWQKPQESVPVWWHPYQVASLMYQGKQIGLAGQLSQNWLANLCEGQIFAFELDGEFLLNQATTVVKYQASSRFQPVSLDISLLVPLLSTVSDLQNIIQRSDARIYKVELIDSFQKDEWVDQKALTFRYYFVDEQKTLSSEQIGQVQVQVAQNLQKNGACVR